MIVHDARGLAVGRKAGDGGRGTGEDCLVVVARAVAVADVQAVPEVDRQPSPPHHVLAGEVAVDPVAVRARLRPCDPLLVADVRHAVDWVEYHAVRVVEAARRVGEVKARPRGGWRVSGAALLVAWMAGAVAALDSGSAGDDEQEEARRARHQLPPPPHFRAASCTRTPQPPSCR